jgi:hypothetical protein
MGVACSTHMGNGECLQYFGSRSSMNSRRKYEDHIKMDSRNTGCDVNGFTCWALVKAMVT